MHTIGDGLVVPQNEQAYASVVRRAGRAFLLRQVFVSRAGHCAFTPAETIAAVKVLLHRMLTGHWDAPRAASGQHERRGRGARPELQHLQQRRQGRAGRSGVHGLPADAYLRPFDLCVPVPPLARILQDNGGQHRGCQDQRRGRPRCLRDGVARRRA